MAHTSMSDADLLKYAIEHGIIDTALVQEKIEMQKRKEILDKHPYEIWEGKNGKWYTYLPDAEKGRILKKRTTCKAIEDVIVEYYNAEEAKKANTFFGCFKAYADLKKEIVSEDTYGRYFDDYRRYFANTWIDEIELKDANSENLEVFIVKRIKELNLRKKAAKAMIGYIKTTFRSARINKLIPENPCDFLQPSAVYLQHCYIPVQNAEQRVVSNKQMQLLRKQYRLDHENKPNYIPTYAVELASLTGMRVGEIAALKWDAITETEITIKREETYNQRTNVYKIVEYTKNKKPRIIPMTKQIWELLEKVREVEKKYGYYGEFVFMNADGQIHKRVIGECSRTKSFQAGIETKSVHALRRTVNSTMKKLGASSTVASSILGNTKEVNDNYYTYDVADIEEKRKLLEEANEAMMA